MNETATTTSNAMARRTNVLIASILFGLLTAGGGFTLAPNGAGCTPPGPVATSATDSDAE